MEIWCNEAQERFVLAIHPSKLPVFEALCERERCPFAVVGRASADTRYSSRLLLPARLCWSYPAGQTHTHCHAC